MRKIDYYITAAIFVLIAFSCGPIVAGGQYVQVGLQASGSGTVEETFVTDIDWSDVYANPETPYTWNLTDDYPGGYDVNLGTHTAKLEGLTIIVKGDPRIELGFSAVSNDGDTNFVFTSDVLVFEDPLINAEAYAEGYVMSITSGTKVNALDFNPKLFRTLYNGTQIFADLVNPYTYPVMSYERIDSTAISGEISSMQVAWSMTVLSGGHAQGSGIFEIQGDVVPEPASILLLGLGGLALIRKRKS